MIDWQEAYDENGNIYYYNINTNETSWELPTAEQVMPSRRKSQLALIQESIAAQISESPWIEKFSEKHQRKYWKHKDTGETTWKEPVIEIEVTKAISTENLQSEINTITKETPWIEKFSEKHQRKYWKHKDTGKTTWNQAETEIQEEEEEKQREEQQQQQQQQ